MRLDRFLANAGLGSRSAVRTMIRKGLVTVDGHAIRDAAYPIPEPGTLSQPDVQAEGRPITWRRHVHLMLNKPAGLVTALQDPRLPTIASLLPSRYKAAGLFPVGRLDRDATGLLLLTNDGELGHRLTSPRRQVWKTYVVTVSGLPFTLLDQDQFTAGILLADGRRCRPARLVIDTPQQARLSIHEGRFHQVKKMMLATGRKVTSLHRISVGPLLLDNTLPPGSCRELTAEEIDALYQAVE